MLINAAAFLPGVTGKSLLWSVYLLLREFKIKAKTLILNAFKQQERRKVAVILHFLATKNKEQILFILMGLLRKNRVICIFLLAVLRNYWEKL